MPLAPRRNHATAVTDDELILLDALFNKDLSLRHLQREDLRIHGFTRRTHHLSNRALKSTIERWLGAGILRLEVLEWMNGETYYGLTPLGGALWEAERTPDWRRYAHVNVRWDQPETRDSLTPISVFSPSKSIGRKYLESRCRLLGDEVDWSTLKAYRRRGYINIPWKRFPYFIEWRSLATDRSDEMRLKDFVLSAGEEACRDWWTNAEELQRFLAPRDT